MSFRGDADLANALDNWSPSGQNASTSRLHGKTLLPLTIYGIRNCDTMKKAFAWLDANGVAYAFHDYRVDGIGRDEIARWCAAAGWEKVLNKGSRTFRALPDEGRGDLDEAKAVALMAGEPTMIKRPVLDTGKAIEIGFRPDRYAALFAG